MALIIPFRGLRYNQEKIKDLRLVVSPPYDVISLKQQSQLYRAHKCNVVRIILGKEKKGDNTFHNRYSRARKFLDNWISRGILTRDKKPSVYIYEQSYNYEGEAFRRNGFLALLKIEPPDKGVILAHEKTFCKPKQDRLKLLKATESNLSPIFGLYSDRNFKADRLLADYSKTKPDADFEFEEIRNRFWRIDSLDFIQTLTKLLQKKRIFIADGHHRYEVAYLYKKLTSEDKRVNADYVMMYFSNLASRGLKILPTHRLIRNIPKAKLEELPLILELHFTVSHVSSKRELFSILKNAGAGRHLFGLYLAGKGFYLLKLKHKKMPETDSCYNNLDVVILHKLILHKLMGIKDDNTAAQNILYTRDEKNAIKLVDHKRYGCAFFLNPPRPNQISAIACASRKMPHKSTYFYPKPLSGLVFNRLSDATF